MRPFKKPPCTCRKTYPNFQGYIPPNLQIWIILNDEKLETGRTRLEKQGGLIHIDSIDNLQSC